MAMNIFRKLLRFLARPSTPEIEILSYGVTDNNGLKVLTINFKGFDGKRRKLVIGESWDYVRRDIILVVNIDGRLITVQSEGFETPWFFYEDDLTENIKRYGAHTTLTDILDYFGLSLLDVLQISEVESRC